MTGPLSPEQESISTYETVLTGDMLFARSITPMVVVDSNRFIAKVNQRFCSLFGYAEDELIGKRTELLTPSAVHFEQYRLAFEQTREGVLESKELLYRKKDGSLFWVKLTGIPLPTRVEQFILWSFDDITIEVIAREGMKNRYRELDIIFERVRAGLIYVVNGIIERANRASLAIVHDQTEQIVGQRIAVFIDDFDDRKASEAKHVKQFYTENGDTVIAEMEIVLVADESYIVVLSDITVHVHEKKALTQLAQTDSLTGVYNRRAFTLHAQQMMIDGQNDAVSLLMLDIDHFKSINDTYGHDVGDEALKDLCKLLQSSLRRDEVLGRLGGEEFGIVLPLDLARAVQAGNRILQAVRSHLFTRRKLKMTLSIGVTASAYGIDFDEMYKEADRLLYVAKQSGRNRQAHEKSN